MKRYVGRIKDQEVVVIKGSRKGIRFSADIVEAVEIGEGITRGHSYYRYKKDRRTLVSAMITLKYPSSEIWLAYPRPFNYGAGLTSTHIHTPEEADALVSLYTQ